MAIILASRPRVWSDIGESGVSGSPANRKRICCLGEVILVFPIHHLRTKDSLNPNSFASGAIQSVDAVMAIPRRSSSFGVISPLFPAARRNGNNPCHSSLICASVFAHAKSPALPGAYLKPPCYFAGSKAASAATLQRGMGKRPSQSD